MFILSRRVTQKLAPKKQLVQSSRVVALHNRSLFSPSWRPSAERDVLCSPAVSPTHFMAERKNFWSPPVQKKKNTATQSRPGRTRKPNWKCKKKKLFQNFHLGIEMWWQASNVYKLEVDEVQLCWRSPSKTSRKLRPSGLHAAHWPFQSGLQNLKLH